MQLWVYFMCLRLCTRDRLSLNNRALVLVSADVPEEVCDIVLTEVLEEVFIVRDEYELEIDIELIPLVDKLSEATSERLYVLLIQVRRRFIESKYAALITKAVCECESDDNGRKHFLAR